MPGLISQQQAAPQQESPPQTQPASAGFSLPANPGQPPAGAPQAQAVEKIQKILLAAKKFMYSPQTHEMFLRELGGDDPVPVKAGRAAAHVILYLFQLSKMQMNPQLVIPSGILILADIVDFIGNDGKNPPDEDVQAEAVKVFMQTIMQTLKLGQPDYDQKLQDSIAQHAKDQEHQNEPGFNGVTA